MRRPGHRLPSICCNRRLPGRISLAVSIPQDIRTMDFALLIPITMFVCIAYSVKVVVDAYTRRRIVESRGSEDMVRSLLEGEAARRRHASLHWGCVLDRPGARLRPRRGDRRGSCDARRHRLASRCHGPGQPSPITFSSAAGQGKRMNRLLALGSLLLAVVPLASRAGPPSDFAPLAAFIQQTERRDRVALGNGHRRHQERRGRLRRLFPDTRTSRRGRRSPVIRCSISPRRPSRSSP